MKMKGTTVLLCLVAAAWAGPLSHNEHSTTEENKDVSKASNVSEHDVVKNNQKSYELQIAREANGNTSLISEGHSGAKSEESGIKESYTSASPVAGAADFVEINENGDEKAETKLNNINTLASKTSKAANGKGAGRRSLNGNMEDGVFGYSPNGTGEGNVHHTSKTERSRLDQNEENAEGDKASSRNKAGDRCADPAGSHSNQVQSLTCINVGAPEISEPKDNANLKSMGSKVYGESGQWPDMNEGASGQGGDTSEEGSTDGWGDGNSEKNKDKTEIHGSKSQTPDGTGTTDPNRGGNGGRGNLADSLSTSEEDSSQEHTSTSAENSDTVERHRKAKGNEHRDFHKKRNRVLGWKGTGKDSYRKKGTTGNHGIVDGNRKKILRDDRKAIGGLPNMKSYEDASKHRDQLRNNPENTRDISEEDKSNGGYSFSNELMQGDDPNKSHAVEDFENSENDEEEITSEDESNEQSESDDGDSGSQPHSEEPESGSQSASRASELESSEGKSDSRSDSSEGKSDSSSESDSKSGSSEGKSDSSSEGKSDSSEGKSDSSSESDSKSDSSSDGKYVSSSESEGKSGSSEGKSDSSEGKSDSSSESDSKSDSSSDGKYVSSSESEGKSGSSEGKSDSSEGKSGSSEGKSDSSSESDSKSDSSSDGKYVSSSESEGKSGSSEGKSDSSEGKSDSSSESDSKSDSSSEGKSDSSSEGKSDSSSESESKSGSSSEGKSGSSSEGNSSDESESSESRSQEVSSDNDSQSGTSNDASDESNSNESKSQSANYSDSGTASMSEESDTGGSDEADTTEHTSDSDSAENKDGKGGSPSGNVDSESESISEGSESHDSTSDY